MGSLVEQLEAADRRRVAAENARDVCIVFCVLGSVLLGTAAFRLAGTGSHRPLAAVLGHASWLCFVFGLFGAITGALWARHRTMAWAWGNFSDEAVQPAIPPLDIGDRIGPFEARRDGFGLRLQRSFGEIWMRAGKAGGLLLWLVALTGSVWLAWQGFAAPVRGSVNWKFIGGLVLDGSSLAVSFWVLMWAVPVSTLIDHEFKRITVRSVWGPGLLRVQSMQIADLDAVELRITRLQDQDRELILRRRDGKAIVIARFRGARGNAPVVRDGRVDTMFDALCEARRMRVLRTIVLNE